MQTVTLAYQRLKCEGTAIGKFDYGGLGDFGQQAADTHDYTGTPEDGDDLRHVLQVKHVARMVLGNQQHATRIRTNFFNRALRRQHA